MLNAPRILLIDGKQEDRDYYAQLLRISSPGFVVFHVMTGQAGLALCQRQPIDCVVLEIDLPDMSGFEVLLKLIPRVQHPEIAAVILTRLANPHLLQAAIKNGAQAALYKGMTSGDILNKAVLNAISIVQTDLKRLAV
jgi:DNA-binding NarL/FixJ family response regulator